MILTCIVSAEDLAWVRQHFGQSFVALLILLLELCNCSRNCNKLNYNFFMGCNFYFTYLKKHCRRDL